MTRAISLITNNGEVGGGEVMLVALAQAVRNLGLDVQVVVPTEPDASAELARQAGFDVVEIPAGDRRSYLSGLARSRRRRRRRKDCSSAERVDARRRDRRPDRSYSFVSLSILECCDCFAALSFCVQSRVFLRLAIRDRKTELRRIAAVQGRLRRDHPLTPSLVCRL